MSSKRHTFKSSEKVLDSSSSDEEPLPPQILLERSPSQASSSSLSPSPSPTSSPPVFSKSPSRTPSPDQSSYQYSPPSTHQLSTSTEKSVLPSLGSGDELFLLRIPKGLSLDNMHFNFVKRRVRIGNEEWKLLNDGPGYIRIIQPRENSEKFEFCMTICVSGVDVGAVRFSKAMSIVRNVQVPHADGDTVTEENSQPREKKRRHDDINGGQEKRRKHEKSSKHKDEEKREHHHNKDKQNQEREQEKHHKAVKDENHKSKKDKHRNM